jgi:hypothetical protein
MATNKKTGTGDKATKPAAKTTGGGATTFAAPEGYTTGTNNFYSESVMRRFDTLPPEGGVVRLMLVTNKGTTADPVKSLLANPRMQLKMRAPGIWEANLMPEDMDALIAPNTGTSGLFRWIDIATRLYGARAENEQDLVTVAVAWTGDRTEGAKKLKTLGWTETKATPPADADMSEGEWYDQDEHLLVGTLPAGKLYDLALMTKAEAIELRTTATTEKAATKK